MSEAWMRPGSLASAVALLETNGWDGLAIDNEDYPPGMPAEMPAAFGRLLGNLSKAFAAAGRTVVVDVASVSTETKIATVGLGRLCAAISLTKTVAANRIGRAASVALSISDRTHSSLPRPFGSWTWAPTVKKQGDFLDLLLSVQLTLNVPLLQTLVKPPRHGRSSTRRHWRSSCRGRCLRPLLGWSRCLATPTHRAAAGQTDASAPTCPTLTADASTTAGRNLHCTPSSRRPNSWECRRLT